MKTLEERLMGKAFPLYSFLDDGDRFLRLNDALAIVADAPRIYRGEEIKDAPEGRYCVRLESSAVPGLPWNDIRGKDVCTQCAFEATTDTGVWEFFGPLPTNSPIEGKG